MVDINVFLEENSHKNKNLNLASINETFLTNKDKFIDKIVIQDNISISTKILLLNTVEKIAKNQPIEDLESHEIGVALQKLKL